MQMSGRGILRSIWSTFSQDSCHLNEPWVDIIHIQCFDIHFHALEAT